MLKTDQLCYMALSLLIAKGVVCGNSGEYRFKIIYIGNLKAY